MSAAGESDLPASHSVLAALQLMLNVRQQQTFTLHRSDLDLLLLEVEKIQIEHEERDAYSAAACCPRCEDKDEELDTLEDELNAADEAMARVRAHYRGRARALLKALRQARSVFWPAW